MRQGHIFDSSTLSFFLPDFSSSCSLPIAGPISAGFPSPAADYLDLKLDLNKELVQNPSATFYGRVKGDSMQDVGIHDGDILVIDRSRTPSHNDIAVCFIDGEFTVKRIQIEDSCLYLVAENQRYKPIKVTEENQFLVWGVVSYVIHKF